MYKSHIFKIVLTNLLIFLAQVAFAQERLDFNMTRKQVYDYIRALNPTPLANILLNGEEIKIVDKQPRKVTEIRVYYDDQTYETFVPAKK